MILATTVSLLSLRTIRTHLNIIFWNFEKKFRVNLAHENNKRRGAYSGKHGIFNFNNFTRLYHKLIVEAEINISLGGQNYVFFCLYRTWLPIPSQFLVTRCKEFILVKYIRTLITLVNLSQGDHLLILRKKDF